MSKSLDRSQRAGSDPLIIGSSKLATDSNNNLSVLDSSDAPKKLIASELEIGDSSSKVIIKKGSDNKVQFQTQASGGSVQDSNAGGGVTVVADLTALQALTGNAVGDLAFVSANNKLYLRQTNGWYTVATVANATPVISSAGNTSYTFATNGTPIVITVTATDSEGETITYGHTVTGSASGIATITQGTGANVNQFTLTPATSGSGGNFSVVFTAQDPNGNTATSSSSSFTLAFDVSGSLYFDGSGDYISTPSSSDFTLGTGDFTIEFWAWPKNFTNRGTFYDSRPSSGTTGITIGHESSSGEIRVYMNASSGSDIAVQSSDFSTGSWQHVAVTRESGTVKLFIGGVLKDTGTASDDMNNTNAVNIGYTSNTSSTYNYYTGYISNFRIVKGTAVYTSAFTPSTSPLTAINNTVYLIASNIVPTQVTNGSTQYSNQNAYIDTPASSDFTLGTGDFTVEGWFNWANLPGSNSGAYIFDFGSNGYRLRFDGASKLGFYSVESGYYVGHYGTVSLSTNTWYHVAWTRASGTGYCYLNGTQIASGGASMNVTTNKLRMNGYGGAIGYGQTGVKHSDVRVVKGKAVYTGNFSPPTGSLTKTGGTYPNNTNRTDPTASETVLLTHQDSSGSVVPTDNSDSNHTLEKSGTISFGEGYKIDTEDASSSDHNLNFNGDLVYSYATPFLNGSGGSVLFDGNGDAVTVTANADFAYGTGDFTIEAWVYSTTYANFPYILDGRTNTNSISNAPILYIHTDNTLRYYVAGSTRISTSYSSYQNKWTHIAIVRNSGTTTLYLDGVSKGTWSDSTNYTDQGPLVIGRHGNSSNATYCLNGYISNFRIVKGTAVYTSNFTVPTSSLTAITNTKLLTCNDSNVINDASSSNHTITSQGNSIPTKFIPFS